MKAANFIRTFGSYPRKFYPLFVTRDKNDSIEIHCLDSLVGASDEVIDSYVEYLDNMECVVILYNIDPCNCTPPIE